MWLVDLLCSLEAIAKAVTSPPLPLASCYCLTAEEGGGGRERGREGDRKRGREGWREGERKGGREGGREGER